MKIVVTGAGGLLGWHASAHLHAANCAAGFSGVPAPYELVRCDRAGFSDAAAFQTVLAGVDAVLHFAGVNRAPEAEIVAANPAIARALIAGCRAAGADPHIVYANSIHAQGNTPYGKSKAAAADILRDGVSRFTDLVLPHVFGECARPDYNNVTATFIDRTIGGETPQIATDGVVELLHAGAVAQAAIAAVTGAQTGQIHLAGRQTPVPELWAMLQGFHRDYSANLYPPLADPFEITLFNSYRAALYPSGFPRPLALNTDPRGTLFEAAKGGSGGQTFLSWTEPGITRGDHFHLAKVERFLVLEGSATIRIRRALHPEIWEYPVTGTNPAPVDMPTLHTHSIENTGTGRLLTLFWTNEVFDPAAPDTYADSVQRN